jgi:uncharacterized protein
MEFEWDEAKAIANYEKHAIAFSDAIRVFDGFIVSKPDARRDYGETRISTTGMIDGLLVVVVIHTDRSGKQRIISARRGNRNEREAFQTALLASSNN